jgi:aspartate carbamoyltransferase catalytic subunit
MEKKLMHLFEAQQFDLNTIDALFSLATSLEENPQPVLRGKIMATLFYEPSTRTRLSFESAMLRLGGDVISTENALSVSSAVKGEPLEDTIRIVSMYADVIVLRYFESNIAERLLPIASVPIINAGDGAGQHPSQALLDLYTIHRELGRIDDITVVMVGDPKHSRSVHSLAYLLGKYKNIIINFVAPEELQIADDLLTYLDGHGVQYTKTHDLTAAIGEADVVYRNRLQKERFESETLYEKYKEMYLIDVPMASRMKQGAILMDPLPRIGGITTEVDVLPQAVYFKQARYGLLIRMALLAHMLA